MDDYEKAQRRLVQAEMAAWSDPPESPRRPSCLAVLAGLVVLGCLGAVIGIAAFFHHL